MTSIFNTPAKREDAGAFAGYGLDGNPFEVDETLATIGGKDDLTRFRRIVCAAEVRRIAKSIVNDLLAGNPQPVWLLEDGQALKQYNNVVATGVFRYLVSSQNPRILPVYVPLPQVANDFTGNVYKLIIDRLLPRYFRNVTYSFICRELEKAITDGQAGLSFDAAGLLADTEATAGRTLDEIFFGAEFTLTMAEEYGGIVQPILAEELPEEVPEEDEGPDFVDHDAEDEAEEVEETVEVEVTVEEEPVDERRAPLLAFINERLTDESSAAGETLRDAVLTALTDGFVEGRHVLEKAPAPRDEIMGLIRLISLYYNGIVVMVDQLDPWPYLNDQERINILSDIYNFELAASGKAMVTVVSDKGNFENFDAGFKKRCRMLPMELKWTREPTIDFGQDAIKAEEFLEDFLNSARLTEASGTKPFDTSGVAEIMAQAGGDILVALDLCRRLIETGRESGFPPIDKSLANKAV